MIAHMQCVQKILYILTVAFSPTGDGFTVSRFLCSSRTARGTGAAEKKSKRHTFGRKMILAACSVTSVTNWVTNRPRKNSAREGCEKRLNRVLWSRAALPMAAAR